MNNPKITFFGGVGSTTGANIMLEFGSKKMLVDCGLLQGAKFAEEKNFENFDYDPKSVDFLLITHAHMDHIGRVPKLVRDGFNGKIISTKATAELAGPMLHDALKVMQAKFPDKILFEKEDVAKTLELWEGYDYEEKIKIFEDCHLEMQDAGHILGSAIINVFCNNKKIAFTGDLGNSPSPLLPDTEFPKDLDFLITESVYGDRNHENKDERREKLKQYILEGVKRGGTIVIPAFSIERTQVLLYEINKMVEGGEIPETPVFLDSPLAEKVTDIYKKYEKDFKKSVQQQIKSGDDIFDFPGLKIVKTAEESRAIEQEKGAKIILAGSGMSEGGRVVNHEARILDKKENTLILVGFQAVGTLGRLLQDGATKVVINKQKIKVKAKIENITGYSSHKDSEHLQEFVEKINESKKLTKVFVIMGEPKSSLFLTQRLRDYFDVDAVYPEEGRVYELA
jgi:metallo-beta-lactamase family protein